MPASSKKEALTSPALGVTGSSFSQLTPKKSSLQTHSPSWHVPTPQSTPSQLVGQAGKVQISPVSASVSWRLRTSPLAQTLTSAGHTMLRGAKLQNGGARATVLPSAHVWTSEAQVTTESH